MQILKNVAHCDLATSLTNVNIGSELLPNSKTLGLMWDPQNDVLRVNCKEFSKATTRREMASQLDPLGIVSPYMLKGKLILQRVRLILFLQSFYLCLIFASSNVQINA